MTKKIVLSILILIAIMAGIEIITKTLSSIPKQTKKPEEPAKIAEKSQITAEKKEKNIKTPVSEKQNTPITPVVEDSFNPQKNLPEFIALLNNKKAQDAYKLLNEDFKLMYFPTFDTFNKYVNDTFSLQYEYTLADQYNFADYTIYKVNLYQNLEVDTRPATLRYLPKAFIENYTIYKKPEGKYKMAFKGFIESKKLNIAKTEGSVAFELIKIQKKTTADEYHLKVINAGVSPINLLEVSKSNIILNYTKDNKNAVSFLTKLATDTQNFVVNSGETKILLLEFAKINMKNYLLKIKNVNIDGKLKTIIFEIK